MTQFSLALSRPSTGVQEAGHHRGRLLWPAVHRQQRREPVAQPKEPNLPADGQCGAVPPEAARQVLRGAAPHPAGANEVRVREKTYAMMSKFRHKEVPKCT